MKPYFPVLLLLLVAGCARQEAATPTSERAGAPVRPGGSLAAGVPQSPGFQPGAPPEAGSPAAALRGFWERQRAEAWSSAHACFSKQSRQMVAERDLPAMVGQSAPTSGSAAAWRGLFPRRVGPLPQIGMTSVQGDRAEIDVRSNAGTGRVVLLRERALWKVDFIGSVNVPPPASG